MAELKLRASEVSFARNPHELMRVLECFSLIAIGEMTLHASLSRRASCRALAFTRLDCPDLDPPEWAKFTTIKLVGNEVEYEELPLNYALLPPYAATYEENYRSHCSFGK
jgi:succinate dehydrogenase/fumarate reductase flavoprotein subunit